MKILHITPHLGGGVGTVICDWMGRDEKQGYHIIASLDTINPKASKQLYEEGVVGVHCMGLQKNYHILDWLICESDIIIVHYWDHPMLADLLSRPLPDCRMVFWCHKNIPYSQSELSYPDVWIDTSPIQGHGKYIWSTGDISRFLEIKKAAHKGFNIGTVVSPKLHPRFRDMCEEIKKRIPDARFTCLGDHNEKTVYPEYFKFTGKVDDVAPYLAEMDVFFYPLRGDHYGTGEQVLGESMAAGVVPVVMDNPCERSIISNFYDGYIAHDTNQAINHIISFLLKTNYGREVVGARARNSAINLYSLDTMVFQWNDVFDSMMSKTKSERRVL